MTKRRIQAWIIWLVATTFYAYEFFLRISPSVMVSELMSAFAVNAATLGTLSAVYYYAYAIWQIPVGVFLDRYGIRRLLATAAVVVAGGSFLFATTHHLYVAEFGRVLMGIGSAFSFVGCLKLAANWFPARQIALVIGLTNMLGVLGAIGGEGPLSLLVEQLGWRHSMILAGIVGACIALLISLVVRDTPQRRDDNLAEGQVGAKTFGQDLRLLVKSPRIWLCALFGGLMVAPISAFTELWSASFLVASHHVSKPEAAVISSIVFVGIAVGGPLNGLLSGVIGRRKPIMWFGSVFALLSLLLVIYVPGLGLLPLSVALFVFGYSTSTMLLAFAMNIESSPSWAVGVAVGFTNMIVMLGGTIFQPLVGWLLDLFRGVAVVGPAETIHVLAYQKALLLLPACQVLAILLLFFMRETYCGRERGHVA